MSSSIGTYPLKIIQPAFGRAGSTSVAVACQILGFGPVWHTVNNSYALNEKGIKYWIKHEIDDKIANGSIKPSDIDGWLSNIECNTVMDAPIAYCWDIFIKFYPNAKVIITVRDYDKLRESQRKMFKQVLDKWWFRWIICNISTAAHWGKYKFLDLAFNNAGWSYKEFMECDKKTFDERHCNTIEKIKSIVPKDQLLIIDISKQGWEPLCKFLNVEIPNRPFPYKNKSVSLELLNKLINAFVAIFIILFAVIFYYFS